MSSVVKLPDQFPELSPLTIAAGGEKLPVINEKGERVEVFVRILLMEQIPLYVAAADNDRRQAEILLGMAEGELPKNFPPVYLQRILSKGHDLNFEAACLWAERRAKVASAMMNSDELATMVAEKILTAVSASSSPSSPRSPAIA